MSQQDEEDGEDEEDEYEYEEDGEDEEDEFDWSDPAFWQNALNSQDPETKAALGGMLKDVDVDDVMKAVKEHCPEYADTIDQLGPIFKKFLSEQSPEYAPKPAQSQYMGLKPWPSRTFSKHIREPPAPGETENGLRSLHDYNVDSLISELQNLEIDSEQRQILLVRLYSMATSLYPTMNSALRDDDDKGIEQLKGYIHELREVFLTDHKNQIVTPFTGTVYRGITFPDWQIAIKEYEKDKTFAWPAFSSTSTNRDVTMGFGNVIFEIRCDPPEGTYDDDTPEYAPAPIAQWSAFPSESEILFPPNVEFRVVNIQYPGSSNDLGGFGHVECVVQCETMAFDSIYGMIELNDVDGIKDWVERNPDRVNNEDSHHSLLHHAVDSGATTRGINLEEDAHSVLLDNGATVDETCPRTGETYHEKIQRMSSSWFLRCL